MVFLRVVRRSVGGEVDPVGAVVPDLDAVDLVRHDLALFDLEHRLGVRITPWSDHTVALICRTSLVLVLAVKAAAAGVRGVSTFLWAEPEDCGDELVAAQLGGAVVICGDDFAHGILRGVPVVKSWRRYTIFLFFCQDQEGNCVVYFVY